MICRNHKSALGAYTFLEIALALGIIAVVFVAMIPMVTASFKERGLRDRMESIGQCVRESRRQAEETGQEQLLVVGKKSLSLREKKSAAIKVKVPDHLKIFVRFPQGEWASANNQEWRIFSCGLVTPASIRLQDGASWLETDFDFLTGNVAGERYSF